jgi:malate dehydrogenase
MSYVAIVGSGNVGANAAFFIAEKGVTDVRLFDVRECLSQGKVLDMMEAAPVRGYRNRLVAAEAIEEIAGAETVIVAAGKVRAPGMRREDLLGENASLVRDLAPRIASLCPQASVIIVTEPVDMITTLFLRASGMDRRRVMGLGGCLDSTRLRYAIARELKVSQEDVSALVMGRHADAMILLPQYCRVSGVPITQLMAPERIQHVLAETRAAGDLIVSLAQRSSAYYAPSAAAAELVDAIHMDLKRIFSVSVLLAGEYGLSGVAMNLPAVIGRAGIERLLTPELRPEELAALSASAKDLSVVLDGRPA